MSSNQILLETKNLSISISNKIICKDLNIQFKQGEVCAILGRNGSGKTTLLHTLAGLRPILSGEICIQNKSFNQLSRKNIAQKLGILLQHQLDSFPSTVLETTLLGRHPHINSWQWESTEDKQISLDALNTVDMSEYANRYTNQLSGGERQRVSIATLLSQSPEIYLLDEPESHLDLHYQIKCLEHFRLIAKQENKLIIMCIHDINLATRFSNYFLMLSEGGQIIYGHKDKVLTKENLEKVYQHPFDTLSSNGKKLFVPV